jgi:hypothetical protein
MVDFTATSGELAGVFIHKLQRIACGELYSPVFQFIIQHFQGRDVGNVLFMQFRRLVTRAGARREE